jgi:hypothetical protein
VKEVAYSLALYARPIFAHNEVNEQCDHFSMPIVVHFLAVMVEIYPCFTSRGRDDRIWLATGSVKMIDVYAQPSFVLLWSSYRSTPNQLDSHDGEIDAWL